MCIKQAHVRVRFMESDRLMIDHPGIALLLLLPSLALADGNADAVNERIPVNRAEMETHWQVNCADAWQSLQTAAAHPSTKDNCGFTAELVREIQMCAFIYQAPGASSQHRCPDYRGASKRLQQHNQSILCSNLRTSILQQAGCQGEIQ